MRVLVLCDDRWHPASTARAGLAPLEGSDFTFDWIEDARDWTAERLRTYPVVLLTKSNNVSLKDEAPWVDASVGRAFVDFVGAGGGLLALHSGTAGYRDQPELRGLLGGVFDHHPPQCAVTIAPAAEPGLAAGISPFTVTDEHYMMVLDDPHAAVFLLTTSEHGTQPGGWTRREGHGRVCVLTPGHLTEVWLHPNYQTMIRNGLRWVGQPG